MGFLFVSSLVISLFGLQSLTCGWLHPLCVECPQPFLSCSMIVWLLRLSQWIFQALLTAQSFASWAIPCVCLVLRFLSSILMMHPFAFESTAWNNQAPKPNDSSPPLLILTSSASLNQQLRGLYLCSIRTHLPLWVVIMLTSAFDSSFHTMQSLCPIVESGISAGESDCVPCLLLAEYLQCRFLSALWPHSSE